MARSRRSALPRYVSPLDVLGRQGRSGSDGGYLSGSISCNHKAYGTPLESKHTMLHYYLHHPALQLKISRRSRRLLGRGF